jgi:hypothetical protein
MKKIVGSTLPVSREAVVKLRHPNWQHILPGSVLEANLKFFGNRLHEIHYKHSWWKRVWYTSIMGRKYWIPSESGHRALRSSSVAH